jgi:hypothetical protein
MPPTGGCQVKEAVDERRKRNEEGGAQKPAASSARGKRRFEWFSLVNLDSNRGSNEEGERDAENADGRGWTRKGGKKKGYSFRAPFKRESRRFFKKITNEYPLVGLVKG